MAKQRIQPGDPSLGVLDAEVQQEALSDPSRVPKFGNDILTLRAQLRAAKAARKTGKDCSDALSDIQDCAIHARDGSLLGVRIYKPVSRSRDEGLPVIVWFHGGGFCLGDLDTGDAVCRQLSVEMRSVVVNVDFRLAPEYPFPTPVNDAWDAVQWVAKNPPAVTADLHRGFIIGGIFTGATLVAVVSHLARDQRLNPPLTGTFLEMPALLNPRDIPQAYATELLSYGQNKRDPIVRPDLLRLFWDSYLSENPTTNRHLASPLLWPDGHHKLPPTCLQVCGADPLRDEALIYERELREKYGLVTRLYFYAGMPHGFATYFNQVKLAGTYSKDFINGFKWLLGHSTDNP